MIIVRILLSINSCQQSLVNHWLWPNDLGQTLCHLNYSQVCNTGLWLVNYSIYNCDWSIQSSDWSITLSLIVIGQYKALIGRLLLNTSMWLVNTKLWLVVYYWIPLCDWSILKIFSVLDWVLLMLWVLPMLETSSWGSKSCRQLMSLLECLAASPSPALLQASIIL